MTHLITFNFLTATAPAAIYTLSLHDALPISSCAASASSRSRSSSACARAPSAPDHSSEREADLATSAAANAPETPATQPEDRKSTRLNSSHRCISYAVFCLKKKKIQI